MKPLSCVGLLTFVGALGLAACADTARVAVPDHKFVNDISGMQRADDGEAETVYVQPGGAKVEAYDSFIVDPVQIHYSDPEMKDLDEQDVQEFLDYFRLALANQLEEGGYRVVGQPGPGTLRLQATVVDLKVPNASANLAMIAGFPAAISKGSVTIEVAFRDAQTNKLNAVMADSRRGGYMNGSPWSTWSDVKASVDEWAEEIREAIDAAKSQAPA